MKVTEVKKKAEPILKRRAVCRAGVFGSLARGEKDPQDIDLLVELPRPYGLFAFLSLKQELEDALGSKVDLVDYATLKPRLKERILRDEIRIL